MLSYHIDLVKNSSFVVYEKTFQICCLSQYVPAIPIPDGVGDSVRQNLILHYLEKKLPNVVT